MHPVEPIVTGMTLPVTLIAKDQPEYAPLPAFISQDGEVITRWKLSLRERLRILLKGDMYLRVLTFKHALQPIHLSTEAPRFEEI